MNTFPFDFDGWSTRKFHNAHFQQSATSAVRDFTPEVVTMSKWKTVFSKKAWA
jgi:hypothetical protein